MKEQVFNLIITILSNFNVSFETWKDFEKEIGKRYIENMQKTTIKKD